MTGTFRIGTRDSRLARRQTECVISLLKSVELDLQITMAKAITYVIVPIKTTGDKVRDVPLEKIGSTGLFTKEIEKALLDNHIDAAVHSLKDLASELPEGLTIGAVPVREDVRDALISKNAKTLDELPEGAQILTGSLRRKAQLLNLRKDFRIEDIRGNVETRLKKFLDSDAEVSGLIMAAAGLKRLGLTEHIAAYIPVETMMPAVGQGALAVEVRADDNKSLELCSKINNKTLYAVTAAERSFLRHLQGGCRVPIGGLGNVKNDILELVGFTASTDGAVLVKKSVQGAISDTEDIGRRLAEKILNAGGKEILESFR